MIALFELFTVGSILDPGLPPHTPYLGTPIAFPPGQRSVSFFSLYCCKVAAFSSPSPTKKRQKRRGPLLPLLRHFQRSQTASVKREKTLQQAYSLHKCTLTTCYLLTREISSCAKHVIVTYVEKTCVEEG